jgi:fatty acid desaturase
MQNPVISPTNEILAQRNLASKELIQGIEDEINQLHVFKAIKRIKEFLFFGLLYCIGAGIVLFFGEIIPLMIMGIIIMGIAFNSLAIFIHEGLHGLLSTNRSINHLLSFLVGIPIMMSATAYQRTHFDHHYELGKKPDFSTYEQHVKKPNLVWTMYIAQLLLGCIIYIFCIPFISLKIAPPRSRLFIILEYGVIAAIWITLFVYVPFGVLASYWLFPLIIMNFLTNIRGLAAHSLGDPHNIYLSSRTVKSSRLVSFLFLYENYHLAHHIFPRVPSYNLKEVHGLIWDRLPQAVYSDSYLNFLKDFFKATFTKDLGAMGVVTPSSSKKNQ